MPPLPGPRITPAPGMQLVTLKVAMSQAEYGAFRLIPAFIEPGQDAVAGDTLEVDPETATRWIGAGIADDYLAEPP